MEVDTVYVIATRRGTYPVDDILRSLRWSSTGSHYTVILDRTGGVTIPEDLKEGYAVLTVEQHNNIQDQFIALLGIKWAIDKGLEAKQYLILDDRCLVMQREIDAWALEHIVKQQVGTIGVRDRLNYEDAYSKITPLFDAWDLAHQMWVPGPETLHEAAVYISGALAKEMYKQNLLPPEGVEQWPLPFGPFISWVSQMLNFYQVAWGAMDVPMPPLYVNHPGQQSARFQPPPHILNTSFKLYFSVRHVLSHSEERIREVFKKMRGDEAKDFEPIRPSVSPKQSGPPATEG